MNKHFHIADLEVARIAGHVAAKEWLACCPVSLGQWRDQMLSDFEAGVGFYDDAPARIGAWHAGFERALCEAIAGGKRHD